MIRCSRIESLFSACWEDELSLAEREALEAHFGACPACRSAYDAFVRGLEAVQSLPRLEAGPGFAEAVLARARAAGRAPAVRRAVPARVPAWLGGREWGWRPALAAAALAVVVGAGAYSMWDRTRVPGGSELAKSSAAPGAPGRISVAPAPETAVVPTAEPTALVQPPVPRRAAAPQPAAGGALAGRQADDLPVVPDSLFDHAYDLEFALDPVHLRRVPGEQKLRPARLVPAAEDGRKASITF
jgi:anti-sigma factor RsiW